MDTFVGFCAGIGVLLAACSLFIIALNLWRDGDK